MEDENSLLKRIVATQALDIDAFKHVFEKKYWGQPSNWVLQKSLVEEKKFTIRQACKLVNVPRSNYGYSLRPNKNEPVSEQLREQLSILVVFKSPV